jgi:hypothetical protein
MEINIVKSRRNVSCLQCGIDAKRMDYICKSRPTPPFFFTFERQ